MPIGSRKTGAIPDEAYQPRKSGPGTPVFLRQPEDVDTRDLELKPYKYIALALVHLRNAFARVPVMLEDNSRPVDLFYPQTFQSAGLTQQVILQPQWETAVKIKYVMITGPSGNNITVQLGDRIWPLTIPATGFILIGPVAFFLARTDPQILWSATVANYTMELMGNADSRGQLV